MQEKIITITIDEAGNSTIDLEGFTGASCEKAFEDFRGGDAVKVARRKPAYYDRREVTEQHSRS